jgi:DNA-binding NarL/FixJ family response regulator
VTVRLLAAFAKPEATVTEPIEPLTEREEEVLNHVAKGSTNTEIADALFISLSTVKFHLASVMTKLGARNRVEIAMWAYGTGRAR